ncbi:MAG TPA: glycerol-3-phosphate responsive antiterminator [Flexivirga sp.]|uniref:glycerol-3-phosphate responsive antiterminator n=1 Tax=Flexivirga sp. TaxID=1962927 RepID=UPI002CDBE22D|nr:glycerol-3-phosphate responsive antiterminator [Flexivirga sp.]HWC24661.1 glycerol-3-phosphate responsive antiterminator [Flexivirga sp.]
MSVVDRLHAAPVIATLFGTHDLDTFLQAPTAFCFVANLPLVEVAPVVQQLQEAGSFPILNVDTVKGLSANPDGLNYLRSVGVMGIVSTHAAIVAKAANSGLLTLQKVFATDRSNLPRIRASIAQSRPHLVQLMPWPVVPRLRGEFLDAMPNFIVSGFVHDRADVDDALELGAVAVSTSQQDLWVPMEDSNRD